MLPVVSLLLFVLHIMFADFMPFKPPALAAHVYFSEFDMLIKKNWYEQIDESIFHLEAKR